MILLMLNCCVDGGRSDKSLGEELPALAKEVARLEAVRMYAGLLFISIKLVCNVPILLYFKIDKYEFD